MKWEEAARASGGNPLSARPWAGHKLAGREPGDAQPRRLPGNPTRSTTIQWKRFSLSCDARRMPGSVVTGLIAMTLMDEENSPEWATQRTVIWDLPDHLGVKSAGHRRCVRLRPRCDEDPVGKSKSDMSVQGAASAQHARSQDSPDQAAARR